MGEGGDAAAHQRVPIQIIEGDQADILEQRALQFAQRMGCGQRRNPVCAEQRLRAGAGGIEKSLEVCREVTAGFDHRSAQRRTPGDLRLETADPFDPRTGAVKRFGDQQHIAVTAFFKVGDGDLDRCRVVQPDHVTFEVLDLAVHQHQRHLAMQFLQFVAVVAEGVHDQPFDVVRAQQGQVLAFLLVIAVGVAYHQAVAVLTAGGFHPMHHGNRIRVADVGDQHADQAGSSTFQAASHLVRAIAQFGNRLFDAQRNRIGQQGAILADKP